MAITLLLLDLNGVLYRYDRDARVAHLAARSGMPAAMIESLVWDSRFEDAGDAGAMDADAYLAGFAALLGGRLDEAGWLAALRASISPIAPALALLDRLRPGVACAVLTNNNHLVRRHFARLYPEMAARAPGRAFASAEFAARKPDPEVFRRCLDRIGAAAGETLFIDDSAANVAGARRAGLAADHVASPDSLAATLRIHRLLA